jgi:hypothetical protein
MAALSYVTWLARASAVGAPDGLGQITRSMTANAPTDKVVRPTTLLHVRP